MAKPYTKKEHHNSTGRKATIVKSTPAVYTQLEVKPKFYTLGSMPLANKICENLQVKNQLVK
jgi:hypothetical protein